LTLDVIITKEDRKKDRKKETVELERASTYNLP